MKNNNYTPHRLRSYLIVFGLLIISFSIVFSGLMFKSKLHPDYPLVFTDANNKLMFITKSNNSKNDIASISNANIVYANNDTRYLLYTNNNTLYLLDTTIGGVGRKVTSNPTDYGFSLDDKYVYYIDSNNDLYVYDRYAEETIKISSNVKKIELIRDNNFLYNQDDNLVYLKLNEKPVIISNKYESVELNSDNKLVLYSELNNELQDYYIYEIDSNSKSKVLENVRKLYDKDNNYTKFIYTTVTTKTKDVSNALKDDYSVSDKNFIAYEYEDYTSKKISKATYEANQLLQKQIEFRNQIREYVKNYGKFGYDLYYKNNNTNTLIASNINKVYYHDLKNQVYSYTTYTFDNNALDIENYDDIEKFYADFENAKLNSMYYKAGNASPSMAYKNVTTNTKVVIRNNSEYYLLVQDQEYYNLYYSKINNRSLKLVGEIDTNLLTNKLIVDYADGYLFTNYINNRYYLNLVNEGRVKTLVEDVNPDYIEVAEGRNNIYYLKKTGDYVNSLNIYNGIRVSKIADDIYSFIYINNDLIYVTKNYDAITKTSDLYRLEGNNRLTLIYKDVADWYSPLKDDLLDAEEEENA